MAITNASRLADFGSGIGTDGSLLEVDNTNDRIGIGTSNPNATLTAGAVGAAGTTLFVYGDARCLGVITATSFVGDITGDVTGNASGTAGGLSGTPSITVASITGAASTLSGITKITATTAATSSSTGALIISGGVGIAKSLFVDGGISVAGTITYNDVTNVDSVGVVTAGGGLNVGRTSIGVTATSAGHIIAAGVITATSFEGSGENLTDLPASGDSNDITACLFI